MTQPAQTQDGKQPPEKSGSGSKWLIGCLVAFVVVVLMAGGCLYLVVSNAKQFGVEIVRRTLVQSIQESKLSDEQKKSLIGQVDALAADVKSGKIGLEELGAIGEAISQSSLLAAGGILFFDGAYITPSGLSDKEKQDARRQLQRFARGVFEDRIPHEAIDQVVRPISEQKPDGSWEVRQKITDAELKDRVADLKKRADAARVPDEPFEVDIAAEFKRVIDQALKRTSGTQPGQNP